MTDQHEHAHGNENDQGIGAMLRYAKHARSMWRSSVNQAVVDRIAPQPNETVVDIGAGAGAGAVVAAKSGATVVAIEPTDYLRRVLGWRRWLQRARERIRVVDGSAESTGLGNESIDALWAVNTMHHWTDTAAASIELARILRPGGRLLLVDEDFDDPAHPSHESFKERHDGHDHGFHMVELDAIADLLRAAGLNVHTSAKQSFAAAPALVIEATKNL